MAESITSCNREEPNPSQESVEVRRVCEELKKTTTVEGIIDIISTEEVDFKLVDDFLSKENPPNTLVGLIIEKGLAARPGNKKKVVAPLKIQIEKGADLTRALEKESKKESRDSANKRPMAIKRALGIESKKDSTNSEKGSKKDSRALAIKRLMAIARALAIESKKDSLDHLKNLLENIFSEIILGEDDRKKQSEEIAAKAANNEHFLRAIDELYQYYSYLDRIIPGTGSSENTEDCCSKFKRTICATLDHVLQCCQKCCDREIKDKNSEKAESSDKDDILKDLRDEFQFHKIATDPYFRSLKWLLESCQLFKGEKWTTLDDDDIILATLQLVSDIKDEISSTDSYLKTEYQKLSDQAEEFTVELLDGVQNYNELSTVIQDKFRGVDDEGIKKVSLIQHAINLRCKVFVVSKNCQYLLKKEIFDETMYSGFWDDPRIKTGTWMPPLGIILMKVFSSFVCAAFKSFPLVVLFYWLLSLFNWYFEKKCCKGFIDSYKRPCQKYLLELWWFIAFLSLVIIRSNDEIFSENDSLSGLTTADIAVLVFVVAFCLRRLTSFVLHIKIIREIPRYWQNWHLFSDILTVVECASLLCFVIAFIMWIVRWHQVDGWRPSDDTFEAADLLYSLGSLLCFFKLAHYLKAEYALGALNLSLYMMITKDVIYFAIIFVLLFFVPFATALLKMYSYYVVDAMNNTTQPLASYSKVYDDLLWTMLHVDKRRDTNINDSDFAHVKILGELYFAVFTVVAVIVAFSMWIATMNYTYENIMQNLDKEYVFSRTKMWMEYIATDRSALPPPLNPTDIFYLCKCLAKILREKCTCCSKQVETLIEKCTCCSKQGRNETSGQDEGTAQRNERIRIIKRLVFRYLRRSLMLDDGTEYLQDDLSQSSASRGQDVNPNHSIEVVTQ